jgi:CTP:molybdopterin cytidylyltransferase MocA
MGTAKALLEVDGRPLIQHLVGSAQAVAGLDRVIVVTGYEPQPIREALRACQRVQFVHNPDHEAGGMLSSVKTAVAAVQASSCEAFFLMLLDQPLVRPQTLAEMARCWEETGAPIVVPAHDQTRGHPVLFAARCADEIQSLPPSATLKDFVRQHDAERKVVDVCDPGVLTDLDTPGDFQLILSLWRTTRCPAVRT